MSQPLIQQSLSSPVVESCDVLVCGGGPAGFAAALAAARSGARTTLLEMHGCLGGIWTSGCLSWIIDHRNKTGIMPEIRERLIGLGGLASYGEGKHSSAYDVEVMKALLDTMALEAGIHVRLHTRVVSAVKDSNRLSHVVTESKSGREAWQAKVFIDATGDGDLAFQAGCRYAVGRPGSGETQPMSLMAIIAGVHARDIAAFYTDSSGGDRELTKHRLYEYLRAHGIAPSYSAPTLFRIHDDVFALMANHEYGYSGTNAQDLTDATLHARHEVNTIVDTLRRSGPPWDGIRLVATGNQIGVREARRIRGRYEVTLEDLTSGRQHPDPICTVTFCVDVHSTNPVSGRAFGNEDVIVRPYHIPLGAAIAADVDGLMLAGRCISGDFLAHSSYRVTGNAVQMGENVGKVAAYCAAVGQLPHEIDFARFRQETHAVLSV
ncbi:MAG: FAD-dependent oxidoreductase [Verrucomicrobiota bacterium JB024]|nr:FAD-dependent oxidoreductase [Verrucomicrobiota bacterium JB024]